MKENLYVIKIGGNIIDDEHKLTSFLQQFAELFIPRSESSQHPFRGRGILVHGGGKLATKLAEKMGIEQKLVNGRRITDEETLKIVTMVYAGYVNKNIVAQLQSLSCNAIGLCGTDGDAILAHKRNHPVLDFGFVGDIDLVNIDLLKTLLERNITIVFAPITHDGKGQLLNTNADTIAQEIAKAMNREYAVQLIYSFEKGGVLMNVEDDNTVISSINPASYQKLKAEEKIYAGMLPKLDNAFAALNNGVKKVIIGKAEELQELIAGTKGTAIVNE